MLVDAQNQGLPLRYFLKSWDKFPLLEYEYDKADRLYVVVSLGMNMKEANIWEINSFGSYYVDRTWLLENGYSLFRLVHLKI